MPTTRSQKKAAPPKRTARLTPFRLRVLEMINDDPHGWLEATELGERLWPGMEGPRGPRQGGPNSHAYAATNQLAKLAYATEWVAQHQHPPSAVARALGRDEWTWTPNAWGITWKGRQLLLEHYRQHLSELVTFSARQCFRCDGTGTLCDICGESNRVCQCEVEDESTGLSDCHSCRGTCIASVDLGCAMRNRAALIGCLWAWSHDPHSNNPGHDIFHNGKQIVADVRDFNEAMHEALALLFPKGEIPMPISELTL